MVGRSLVSLAVVALLLGSHVAHAAPKVKPKPAAAKPAKPAPAKPAKPKKGKESDKEKAQEREDESDKPDEPNAADEAKASTKEEGVKAAGTATPKTQSSGDVKVKEDKEGVKTYKFETVEVEGRLKSPQVIYFLRRVRAEFEAGALGHRSFLGELSDSRRSAAFR